jgi:hypothetical protein
MCETVEKIWVCVGRHETTKRREGTKLDVRWLEENNLCKLQREKTWSIMKKGRYRKIEKFKDLDRCVGYTGRVQKSESTHLWRRCVLLVKIRTRRQTLEFEIWSSSSSNEEPDKTANIELCEQGRVCVLPWLGST